MNVIKLTDKTEHKKTAVAVGNFDGVHVGHTALLSRTVSLARENGLTPAVWTFSDYAPKPNAKHIMPAEERYKIFKEKGIEIVFENGFNEVKDLSPEKFVKDRLIDGCGAEIAVCGYNFRFGKKAAGDAMKLKALMEQSGKCAFVEDEIKINGMTVSSTAVRAALKDGDVRLAAALLGRPFSVTLPVIHGRRIGTGLGFPTVNQAYPETLTEMRRGVYVCRVEVDGKDHKAVTNVGVKPTLKNESLCIETHIIDCSGDFYGRDLTVRFYGFLRDEKKFASLDELKQQIKTDTERAVSADI